MCTEKGMTIQRWETDVQLFIWKIITNNDTGINCFPYSTVNLRLPTPVDKEKIRKELSGFPSTEYSIDVH